MRKAAHLLSSVSRNAGGLFYCAKRLTQAVAAEEKFQIEVLGLEDEFSKEDLPEWSPVPARAFSSSGPNAYRYSSALRRALFSAEVEVLHLHGLWMYPSRAALLWRKQTRQALVVSPHGMLDPWALKNSPLKKALANFLFQRKCLEEAACLSSLCDSETQSIRDLGFKQAICQIPNGVDLPLAREAGPAPWTGSLKESDKVLLFLGRLHPKKGLEALVEAFARVQAAKSKGSEDWYLVLAGWDQNGHQEELQALVKKHGMEKRIFFPGPLFGASKDNAFRAASAFILPSFSEGLPVAVLEAWSYALPVLMTPECNLPEGFKHDAAVKITNDVDTLEVSLKNYLAGDLEEHKAMGERGLALVAEQFSWKRIGRDMNAVYQWLLEGGPAPACVKL